MGCYFPVENSFAVFFNISIVKLVSATQDGYIGPNTIKAMQKYFGTVQDGCISNPSLLVKAVQKWLNSK